MKQPMTLRGKVFLYGTFLFIALLAMSFLGLHTLRQASEQDNIARINQLMSSTANIITQLEHLSQTGRLDESQAKLMATEILRENKYHDSEYVYVVDDDLNFVAAPHDPQLHNTSFNDFKDADGSSIGQRVKQLTATSPGKIVTYHWHSERDGHLVELTSVVQRTQDWGWYVGTGISYQEVDARYWGHALGSFSLSIIMALALSLTLGYAGLRLHSALGAEIDQVQQAVMKVAAGDLSFKADWDNPPANSVAGAITTMQFNLQRLIKNIQQVSAELQFQSVNADTRFSELDHLTHQLEVDTDMVASTLTELTASARDVSANARLAADSVKQAELLGSNACDLTRATADTIDELGRQMDKVGDTIGTLNGEVEQIVGVLSVIQGIADQTNLLALNAAIEAARAGEQGRGFAVVADEVRHLAQRTHSCTEEIQSMINKLQQATVDVKQSVNTSTRTSSSATEKSSRVAQELEQVSAALAKITGMSHQIDIAAEEQLKAGEDTSQRVVAISDNANAGARLSEQARHDGQQIKQLTASLEQELGRFRLPGEV